MQLAFVEGGFPPRMLIHETHGIDCWLIPDIGSLFFGIKAEHNQDWFRDRLVRYEIVLKDGIENARSGHSTQNDFD